MRIEPHRRLPADDSPLGLVDGGESDMAATAVHGHDQLFPFDLESHRDKPAGHVDVPEPISAPRQPNVIAALPSHDVVERGRFSAATGSALGLVALTLIAAMGSGFAAVSSRSDQRAADRSAALIASDRFSTSLTAVTSSVAGVDVLAIDGAVSAEEFESFGTAVAGAGDFPALAFVELVPDRERESWEARTGISMQDTDGNGDLIPAAPRPMHAVVRYAAPVTDTTRRVVGFDLMSDPMRADGIAEATRNTGAQLVGPISTVTGARPGLFMTAGVRDPTGRVVGFVAVGISLDDAAQRLDALTGVRVVGVTMDGTPLLDLGRGPASETFTLAGRTFTVYAGDGGSSSWVLPGLLGLATLLLGVAAVRAVRQDRRVRAQERRSGQRSALLARFAEDLVTVSSSLRTGQLAADQAGAIVGAQHTNVGIRLESDPTKLRVAHDPSMNPGLADRYALQSVDDDLPLAEAARDGTIVWISNRDDYVARYPHVADDITTAGIHAVCCVPLSLGNDPHAGAIGFAFDHPIGRGQRAEIETAANIISQMTGRALDRARVRELVQERVDLLADLARELTTVRFSEQVTDAVARMVPPLLDLGSAELIHTTPPRPDATTRVYRPTDDDSAHLILRHADTRGWASIDETLATTVADLVGGALSRTRLQDQERAVLQRLQATLLTAPPDLDGFDIAVGYRSALTAIGMGGDWYSIIDAPDAVYAVIGDIAGHGPGAVALMAEVKTIIRHLLTVGTPIDEAVAHADHTLQRRNAYASMIVARIDKTEPTLEYINAGHLPALIYTADGIVALDRTHRPWLGVESHDAVVPSVCPLGPGELLLLYTDGLVEQRDEPLDTSIRTRLYTIDHRQPATELVDHLLATREHDRNAATVDDDVAIVAVHRARTGR
jgi:GAF domain-containing protein